MIIADTKPRSTQIMSALIGVLIVRNVAIAITLLTVKKFSPDFKYKKTGRFPSGSCHTFVCIFDSEVQPPIGN